MGFQHRGARAFKAAVIRRAAPPASGVYALSNSVEWIYIGVADDIRARLLNHLAEPDSAVADRRPTGFSYELCSPEGRLALQAQLTRELKPVCNDNREQRHSGRNPAQEKA
jgi:hypothetical protein